MSVLNDPVGFDLDDILTRVIPGAVFVFSTSIAIHEFELLSGAIDITPYSTSFIAFGIVLSFIFGELIELFRYQVIRTPRTFNRLVYRTTGDRNHLHRKDQFRVWLFDLFSDQDVSESGKFDKQLVNKPFYIPWMDEEKFSIERQYDENIIEQLSYTNPLPGDQYVPEYLYYHLLKQVESSLNKDAKRRQALTRFYMNFKISFIPTALSISYLLYIRLETVPPYLFAILSLLVIVLSYLYGAMLVGIFLRPVQVSHVADLLREYIYQNNSAVDDSSNQ